ncbi:MAG TPA: RNA methyltransferase [Acidimicrobiales bacterium]|nr:RNA methyltransferase [Acidimicrobiales bacterium]
MATRIDDPADARLDDYRQLKDPARQTLESTRRVFVVEGRLAVAELLRSRYEIVSLLVGEHQATRDVGDHPGPPRAAGSAVAASALVAPAEAAGARVYVASRATVASTVGFDLHRGVVAVARRPEPLAPEELVATAIATARDKQSRPMLAVLEGLNDHENLGALFRNAAAFGVAGVLLDPRCADPLYRRSVRVSLGQVLNVPFARLASWPAQPSELLRRSGIRLAALAPEHSSSAAGLGREPEPLRPWARRVAATQPVALLLGAEGPGLTRQAIDVADDIVAIPIAAGVDSLNVATAAALAFYELGAARCSEEV